MQQPAALQRGAVVAGRYRVTARVGTGAWGEVWAADDVAGGTKVAVKTLLEVAHADEEAVTRFRREAYYLGRIQSSYVSRVLDFIVDTQYGLVLVMEFIEGEPLSALLKKRNLTVEEAIDLGADVAAGLCDLHTANVVHRDLKPANIILRPLPDGRKRAMIVDFSLSRLEAKGSSEGSITDITKSNMALGTLPYMAPEQVLNSKQVTAQSDLYALGAILFRTVVGRHVFDEPEYQLAHTKLKKDPDPMSTGRGDRLASGLETIVNRAIRRKPSDRYANARDMSRELEALRDLVNVLVADDEETFGGAPKTTPQAVDRSELLKTQPIRTSARSTQPIVPPPHPPAHPPAHDPRASVPLPLVRAASASSPPPAPRPLGASSVPPPAPAAPTRTLSSAPAPAPPALAAPAPVRSGTPPRPASQAPAEASERSVPVSLDSIDRLLASHPPPPPERARSVPPPGVVPPDAASGPSLGVSPSGSHVPAAAASAPSMGGGGSAPAPLGSAPYGVARASARDRVGATRLDDDGGGGGGGNGRTWALVVGGLLVFVVGAGAGALVMRSRLNDAVAAATGRGAATPAASLEPSSASAAAAPGGGATAAPTIGAEPDAAAASTLASARGAAADAGAARPDGGVRVASTRSGSSSSGSARARADAGAAATSTGGSSLAARSADGGASGAGGTGAGAGGGANGGNGANGGSGATPSGGGGGAGSGGGGASSGAGGGPSGATPASASSRGSSSGADPVE